MDLDDLDGFDECDGYADRLINMMNGDTPTPLMSNINSKIAKMTGAAEGANTVTPSAHGNANSMPDAPPINNYRGLGKTGFENYPNPREFLDARTPEGREEVLKKTGIAVTPINNRQAAFEMGRVMHSADPDGSRKCWYSATERYVSYSSSVRRTLLSSGRRQTYDMLLSSEVSLFAAIYPGMDEDGRGGGGMHKNEDEMSLSVCAFRAVLKIAEDEDAELMIMWLKGGVVYTILLPSVSDALNAK